MNKKILRFLVSKKRETERLTDLFREYKWFIDNDFPIILPKIPQIVKDGLLKKPNKKTLGVLANKILRNEYNKEKYLKNKILIEKEWQKVEKGFFEIIKKINFKMQNKYMCYLSFYGPQGQFYYPNIIDVRTSKKDIKSINETIAHEIIHLLISNKARKLKLNYEQAESVVDLFFKETELKKIFSNYQLQNSIKHDKNQFKSFIS